MERDEVLRGLRKLAKELGKETLTSKDIRESSLSMYWVRMYFDHLADALEAAGLQPTPLARSMAATDDDLLDYLADLQNRLGRPPRIVDLDRDGKYGQRVFYARFGSPREALARLKERKEAEPVSTESEAEDEPVPTEGEIGDFIARLLAPLEDALHTFMLAIESREEENRQLRAELDGLRATLQEERKIPLRRIVDEELRDDCTEFLEREDTYQDAITRAGRVLEERLRHTIGGNGEERFMEGVRLVDYALNPESGKLVISEHPGEQDGVRMLFRGAVQFVRNPPSHKKLEYTDLEAWRAISLIDYLLSLLAEARHREE
jgi:uncharacterized protein (TIGR02391 family)